MNQLNRSIENVITSLWNRQAPQAVKSSPARCGFEALEPRQLMSVSGAATEDFAAAAAAGTRYVAVLDATQNFGTTKRAVNFYDVTNLTAGVFGQQPLFSVWTGYENAGALNFEDPQAITVDPSNGTVYMAAFDSLTAGNPIGFVDAAGDTEGDMDLYRLDFQEILADFTTNNRARGTMYAPTLGPDGATNPQHPDRGAATVNIAGAIQKVGEVARAQSSEFYDFDMEFVSQDRIVFLDNQTGPNASGDTLANDHQIRLWERVAGPAAYDPTNNEGGFNGANTVEDWESIISARVNMDYDATTGQPVGRSEPVDIAYVSRDGVEGVWVGEADSVGDDVAFFQFDANGAATKKEIRSGPLGGPHPTGFTLDENPVVNANSNDGEFDWVVTKADGDLLIGESGFNPTGSTRNVPAHEPKIIGRDIINYDGLDTDLPPNGKREIEPGAWSIAGPIPAPTNDDDTAVTDGRFVTYDKTANRIFYFDIDSGAQPNVVADAYVVDAATGAFVYQEQNAANHFLERHGIRFFEIPAAGGTATAQSAEPMPANVFASSTPIGFQSSSFGADGEEQDDSASALLASL